MPDFPALLRRIMSWHVANSGTSGRLICSLPSEHYDPPSTNTKK